MQEAEERIVIAQMVPFSLNLGPVTPAPSYFFSSLISSPINFPGFSLHLFPIRRFKKGLL